MKKPAGPLTGALQSVTLKLDKENETIRTAKLVSYDSPRRLGGLSGKDLQLQTQGGKRGMAAKCGKVTHSVDEAGEKPRIKTVLTLTGEAGMEEIIGLSLEVQPLQRDLPGMSEEEDGAA